MDGRRVRRPGPGRVLQGAEAGRDSRYRGASRPHRQAAGSEGGRRLCARGLRDCARQEGGIRAGRQIGDQRQSEGHEELAGRRMDLAAHPVARATRIAPSTWPSARRTTSCSNSASPSSARDRLDFRPENDGRSVAESRESKRRRVDRGRLTGREIGGEPPRPGTDPKTMSGESRGDGQPGDRPRGADVGDHVRRGVDVPGPLLNDGHVDEIAGRCAPSLPAPLDSSLYRVRGSSTRVVSNGLGPVERPAPRRAELAPALRIQARLDGRALLAHGRPEFARGIAWNPAPGEPRGRSLGQWCNPRPTACGSRHRSSKCRYRDRRRRGPVRNTEDSTFSCGSRMPRLAQNRLVHAPAASMTVSQAMVPRSVTTAPILPADRSIPRTAQCARMTAPMRCAARAIAGAAFCGSAQPSEGTCSPQRKVASRAPASARQAPVRVSSGRRWRRAAPCRARRQMRARRSSDSPTYTTPHSRKPVALSVNRSMSRHSLRLSTINGISRSSRPVWRHQPQLRLDCSQAM